MTKNLINCIGHEGAWWLNFNLKGHYPVLYSDNGKNYITPSALDHAVIWGKLVIYILYIPHFIFSSDEG